MPAKLTLENFLERAALVHNNKYDYSLIETLPICTEKIKIICPFHGVFEQRLHNHLISGQNCKKCALEDRAVIRGKSQEEFINEANIIHNYKYNYDETIYVRADNKVTIRCPEHGPFIQKAITHLEGAGCRDCGYNNNAFKRAKTLEEFITEANIVHNNFYTYEKSIYVNSRTPIIITCPNCGDFSTIPNIHLRGHKCRSCPHSISNGEKRITEILSALNIHFEYERTFPDCRNPRTGHCLRFDFYLESINTIIEYDGKQHFEPVSHWGGDEAFQDTQFKDTVKNNYCSEKGINLIRIKYTEDILEKLKVYSIVPFSFELE